MARLSGSAMAEAEEEQNEPSAFDKRMSSVLAAIDTAMGQSKGRRRQVEE